MNDIGVVIEFIHSSLFDCYIVNINSVAYKFVLLWKCLSFVFNSWMYFLVSGSFITEVKKMVLSNFASKLSQTFMLKAALMPEILQ